MTNSDRIELRNFESEVRQLLKSYKSLKSEVGALRKQIALKDEEIERLEGELRNSRRLYSNLKTAKMLEVSDSDVKESKLRITRLVREVNKCIRLLSAEEIDDEIQEDETVAISDVKEDIPEKGKEEDGKEKETVVEEETGVEETEETESVEEENIIEETGDEISEEETAEEETIKEEIKSEEEVAEVEEEETFEDEIKEDDSPEEGAVENIKEETSEASSVEESVEGEVEEKDEEEFKESEKVEKKVRSSKSKKEVDPWDFGMLPLFPDDDL